MLGFWQRGFHDIGVLTLPNLNWCLVPILEEGDSLVIFAPPQATMICCRCQRCDRCANLMLQKWQPFISRQSAAFSQTGARMINLNLKPVWALEAQKPTNKQSMRHCASGNATAQLACPCLQPLQKIFQSCNKKNTAKILSSIIIDGPSTSLCFNSTEYNANNVLHSRTSLEN